MEVDRHHFIRAGLEGYGYRDATEWIFKPGTGLAVGSPQAMLHRGPVRIAEPITGQEGELYEQGAQVICPDPANVHDSSLPGELTLGRHFVNQLSAPP